MLEVVWVGGWVVIGVVCWAIAIIQFAGDVYDLYQLWFENPGLCLVILFVMLFVILWGISWIM